MSAGRRREMREIRGVYVSVSVSVRASVRVCEEGGEVFVLYVYP